MRLFEEKISALEGGVGAVATASVKQLRRFFLISVIQEIISQHPLRYHGGTYNLFQVTFKKLGIEVSFVDPEWDEEKIIACLAKNEGNICRDDRKPRCYTDFEKSFQRSQKKWMFLYCRQYFSDSIYAVHWELGADIVIHSATKYIDVLCNKRRRSGDRWRESSTWDNGKYPELVEPDPSYHGLKYLGNIQRKGIYYESYRVQMLRDYDFV